MRPSFSLPQIATLCIVIAIGAVSAPALILVGRGNAPIKENNWPAGSLELANLKTRVGWWEGPPFGGGQHNFLYRGDSAAFQQALDTFARIKAPRLDLYVHDAGPAHTSFLKDEKDPRSDDRYDWSFTVWNPESWHHLYNTPGSYFSAQDPNGGFGNEVEPPRIDLFPAQGRIDFSHIKVPAAIHVTDERADANGYPGGSAVVGDAFDMTTSKPVRGATVTIDGASGAPKHAPAATAKADAAGHFVLRAVPGGTHRVWVVADGYAPRLLGYADFHGNTFKRFIARLAPLARVRGTVVDTAGKPVANATVRADSVIGPDGRGYIPPDTITARSDGRGAFEISGLPRGHAQLFVYAPSYAMLDVLKLESMPDDHIALKMTATGTVKVRVLDHNGKPASHGNVSIDAQGRAPGSWGGSADTHPDGTFTFENVPPGTYIISAMATNPGPAPSPRDPKKTVQLQAGQNLEIDIEGR